MEELIISSVKLMENDTEEKAEIDCENVGESIQEIDAEQNDSLTVAEENDPETTAKENSPETIVEENNPEVVGKDVSTNKSIQTQKSDFVKFRQIMNEHLNGETVEVPDGVIQSVLTSYTLAGYLDHAVPLSKELIVMKLHRDCCTTLLDLLRITEGLCFIHEKMVSAIVHLIKMQLLKHYPKFSTQGYEALYSCPPTIYLSALCIPTLGNLVCKKMGLPSSSVKVMQMTGQDLSKLENSLQEDLAAKRVPIMIIASIGSHHTGEVDNLIKVTQLSQQFKTWLHLEGHLISQLGILENVSPSIQIADSLHLDLRQWLGIPSLPFVTMYRHCETALQKAACLTPGGCSPFTVVPLWFALQGCNAETINKRFKNALELTTAFVEQLSKFQNINIMSHIPKTSKYLAGESKNDDVEAENVETASTNEETAEGTDKGENEAEVDKEDAAIEKTGDESEKADAEVENTDGEGEKNGAELGNVGAEMENVGAKVNKDGSGAEDNDTFKEEAVSEMTQTNDEENKSDTEKDEVENEEIDEIGKEAEENTEVINSSETAAENLVEGEKHSTNSDVDLKEVANSEPEEDEDTNTEIKESALEDDVNETVEGQIEKDNAEERTKAQALMTTVCPVVVFQYRPKTKGCNDLPTNVLDDLNFWLVQVLERASDVIHIDVIDADPKGYALRFSPYDCKTFPNMEQLMQFIECFTQQMEILNATVEHKNTLVQVVESSEELQLVELPGWAGLGGVRYLPASWRSPCVEDLPDQGKEEINKINRELVARLKITDSAFSIGEGKDKLCCVRFGMVVAVTDVTALANLVRQTGLDIEASTLALETMAVMIRKGIEEAQAELEKETKQQLWEEGLLRHIPVVGSLVNYFSPLQRNTVKGRTLNLQSGRIEKTDIVIQPSLTDEARVKET